MEEEGGILISDVGCVRNYIITIIAWHVFEYKNHKQRIMGYQDESEGKVYPIVDAVTKAWIQGRYLPVLLVINYSTLLNDTYETEYLDIPFEMMKHGATFDMTPRNLVVDGGLYGDE